MQQLCADYFKEIHEINRFNVKTLHTKVKINTNTIFSAAGMLFRRFQK